MAKNKRDRRYSYINQHAAIESRPNADALIGGLSFTANREDDFGAEIFTDTSNTTRMGLFVGPLGLSLSGRQARTLQRLLNKHFSECGVPAIPGAE
jgi:hypothetical protein